MSNKKFYLYVTVYNYRHSIFESDQDLNDYDSDELEELLSEQEENDELDWIDDLRLQRKEPTEVENSSGDKYTIVFNDSKLKFNCPNCPTSLFADSESYLKNKEYKCPKCSTLLLIDTNNSDNFVLMQS